MMRPAPIALIALMLVACSQEESAPVDSEVSAETAADDEVLLPGERSLADEAPTGVTRAAEPAQPLVIPQRFRGVWDYAEGSCMPSSDLRMEIGTREIAFYESIGEARTVRVDGEAVVLDLAMSGEGEQWEQRTRLELTNGGRNLVVRNGDEETPGPYSLRKRCPEQK